MRRTQLEVASYIGVSEGTVGRWERGERLPHPYHRKKLCDLFGKSEIAVIKGLPGVGKTALAIAIAHDPEILQHFGDGMLWVSLGPTPNLSMLRKHWTTLLHPPARQTAIWTSSQEWIKEMHELIALRSMLLIIDDAWHIEDILALKIGGPRCAYVITTRFPAIAAHLTLEEAVTLQELNSEESMTLLSSLAPHTVQQAPQQMNTLVDAIGGHPLALRLIGNYLRQQAYSGQRRRIHRALGGVCKS